MAESGADVDARCLAAAIRLGRSGLGTTWPNPSVGAILVKEGRVLARARTAPGGRPHAETIALADAGEAARGATLYVSLEPCAHHGRTPPCAEAIIAAGVRRVVAAAGDPDPRVAGRGFGLLRAAGIECPETVGSDPARRAHAGHRSRVERGRPFVTLKLAVSADDAIGREGEAGTPVTGEIARRHVQALRCRFDAILVGSGTVLADDPHLTVRLPGLEHRSPVRIVLDSGERLRDGAWHVLDDTAPTWIFGAEAGPAEPGSGDGVRRFAVPRAPDGLDLAAVLGRLGGEGVTSVLVEGGALVARSLIEAELLDAAILFRSPVPLGDRAVPALAGTPLAAIEASPRFRRVQRRRFGPDTMTLYERR
jgi:diaminohydroxyphosphoribosylaminopyrimidine deaminase/5-amino-6-(5-phosphoribosylamino)uracil reductase